MPSLTSSAAWPVEPPFYVVLVVRRPLPAGRPPARLDAARVERPARAAAFYSACS